MPNCQIFQGHTCKNQTIDIHNLLRNLTSPKCLRNWTNYCWGPSEWDHFVGSKTDYITWRNILITLFFSPPFPGASEKHFGVPSEKAHYVKVQCLCEHKESTNWGKGIYYMVHETDHSALTVSTYGVQQKWSIIPITELLQAAEAARAEKQMTAS